MSTTIAESNTSTPRPRRHPLLWFGVAAAAVGAAAVASTLPLTADSKPAVKPAGASQDGGTAAVTELDIRGIPTWWSGWEPAP